MTRRESAAIHRRLERSKKSIVSRYDAQETLSSLARRYGVRRETIRAFLKRQGVEIRPVTRKTLDTAAIIEAYQGGAAIDTLAKQHKVNWHSIQRVLVAAGVKIRKGGPRMIGPKNPRWKGGRYVRYDGYVMVFCPDHPSANAQGYVREHRLVLGWKIGRPLTKDEISHHLDGNRGNNDPANLALVVSGSAHSHGHWQERAAMAGQA